MAIAMILIECFSDTKNIEHNNMNDKSVPKKRAMLMKKSNEEVICNKCYTYCQEFGKIMEREKLEEGMKLWDAFALVGVRKVGEENHSPASNLTNVVPRSLQRENPQETDVMDAFNFFPLFTVASPSTPMAVNDAVNDNITPV